MTDRKFATDIERIYHLWHERARGRDVEGLLSMYTEDAMLESPLVPAIMDRADGMLKGQVDLREFFKRGTAKRPNELIRWQRSGEYFTNGRTLIWEYPHAGAGEEQIDILEIMDLHDGRIGHHRIYWGWFGVQHLLNNAFAKR
jgi:hypothetical protein